MLWLGDTIYCLEVVFLLEMSEVAVTQDRRVSVCTGEWDEVDGHLSFRRGDGLSGRIRLSEE